MTPAEYTDFDAIGLAQLIRRGDASPSEVAQAAIARIEAVNPALNAVITRRYDAARREAARPLAEGPFMGVPFLLKDLNAYLPGTPVGNGSRFWQGFVPTTASALVDRYLEAGFVVLGRTNTPELGLAPVTEPVSTGPTRNPWDLARTPGGSSGGSAAAVASGMVPAAHGGDGGGSIRIPSSCCGLFGLKPTRARTPAGPGRGPHWFGATVEHVLTRSVRDSAAILDATAGPDIGAPYFPPPPVRPFLEEVGRDPGRLRIAFTTRPFLADAVDPACVDAVHETVSLLGDLGHTVEEAAPGVDRNSFATAFLTMLAAEVAADIAEAERVRGRRAAWADFEPTTWALATLGRAVSAPELAGAVRRLEMAARDVGAFFERFDVLLTPTLAAPPLPIGSLEPRTAERMASRVLRAAHGGRLLKSGGMVRDLADRAFAFMPFTPVFNASGQPAMSVPLHTAGNLPIGVQFVGPYAGEGMLFRLAGQLELARPWIDRRPPLAAPQPR